MSTWNYETLKEEATRQGVKVADLLALAPQNDPFYTGRPAELEAATWFYTLYRRFNYAGGVHLRRIHYQIVSQDPPVKMPNGEPYENTLNCWDFLNNAAKWARYLDYVPADQFVDRRNPDAIIHSRFYKPDYWMYEDPTPVIQVTENATWEPYAVPALPELPNLPEALPDMPNYDILGYSGIQQPYLIEVWAEKTTMNDVLLPLCSEYGVNLVTGAGELSITAVIQFLKRVEEADRPARILYISDFDPAGLGMPISVARKIEFYLRQREGEESPIDVKLDPIVLTPEQITQYNLPRVPVKDSDKRKGNFESAYGQGQVELDALEALYPGVLKVIVREAIHNYYDEGLQDRAYDARRRLDFRMDDERGEILSDKRQERQAITQEYATIKADYEQTRQAFAAMIAAFQPQLDAYRERLGDLIHAGESLYTDIRMSLEDVAASIDLTDPDYTLPDPELPNEPQYQLYESWRSYTYQLEYYKAQRHNRQRLAMEEA